MQQFVIIFRQGRRQLTEAELKERAAETRLWAQGQNAAGHKLEPRILAPERYVVQADGNDTLATATDAPPITALLFLAASDFAQAVEIAKSHPAVRYGADVEVRPWSPPIAPS